MISFAGIPLGQPDNDLVEWIAANIDPRDIVAFVERHFPGPGLLHLDGSPNWPHRPIRINELYWPTGAARFSVGYFVCDQEQLDAIRLLAFFDDDGAPAWTPRPLIVADGLNSIETDLYCLPARPLQQITLADAAETPAGLYLLTLVDERYLWWFRQAHIQIAAGATTWEVLYDDLFAALEVDAASVTIDAVHADYLAPPADLETRYESLPIQLDAIAFCVSQRLVRALDGTIRMWSATESVAQHCLNMATLFDENLAEDGTPVDKLAGGLMTLGDEDETGALAGDNLAVLPESVLFVFHRRPSDSTPYTVEVDLADLEIEDYQQAGNTYLIGFPGRKVFHAAALPADFTDGEDDPDNLDELTALTERYATDWYLWQQARLDLVLVGYPQWVLTGLEDSACYRHGGDALSLRLQRGPWNDHREELFHHGEGSGACEELILPGRICVDPPPCNSVTWEAPCLKIWDCELETYRYICEDPPPGEGSPPAGSATLPDCLCNQCPEGSPEVWTLELVAGWGVFADMNGTWELEWDSDCSWTGTLGSWTGVLFHNDPSARWQITFSDGSGNGVVYTAITPQFDCCDASTFFRKLLTGAGDIDGDFVLAPAEGEECAPCYDDTPPPEEGPICDCDECPDGAPPQFQFTVHGALKPFGDANGIWTLTYDSGCTWTGALATFTGTLAFVSGITWRLTIDDGAGAEAIYENVTGWRCCNPTSFILTRAAGGLWRMPTLLTVEPLGTCMPCPDGGGGGGGGVEVACCPSDTLPATLTAELTNIFGCACLDGLTFTLVHNGLAEWTGTAANPCGAGTLIFRLGCLPFGWAIQMDGSGGGGCTITSVGVAGNCNPVDLFNANATVSGTNCNGSVSVTVTE